MTRMALSSFALIGLALPACFAVAPATDQFEPASGIRLETVASGLEHPVHLASPPSDPRLFIVEQQGRIRIVANGRLLRRPFLDITRLVRSGGEQGLLSVAFHPDYARNGFFFVNYTNRDGDTRVVRYKVGPDPDVADPGSARIILAIEQPYSNHNGGHVLFGPDGMLYIGMGDGGSGGDPHRNGQNRSTLLGKLLRIDVNRGYPYAIPPDNPFVGRRDARPEIWALGLRNPWRFCFDAKDGLIYIADVGQNHWEEVDVAPMKAAGLNYGWNIMEGAHCFRASRCDRSGLVEPAVEYPLYSDGCSVTGGLVYRGRRIPALVGRYVFSDYCKGWIRSFRYASGRATERREWSVGERFEVSSFGQDSEGELYVIAHEGRVMKIVPG